MSDAASQRLCDGFDIDRHKVVTIPHGATLPTKLPLKRSGRPTLLTWGLLGPGKGVERVIDAMGSLRDLNGRPRYLIAGRTHPKVLAADGEAYRDARTAQAQRRGVADSVFFDPAYRDRSSLTALVQSSAVVVLPYDSTDQVTSGVLVDAIASGRPVVATAFPHAVELLTPRHRPARAGMALTTRPSASVAGRTSTGPYASLMPRRSYSLASGLGAHQITLPSTRMNAGTSSMRTSVASTKTAAVSPTPNIRMNETCAAINAANAIDINSAAAVTTRPVRATPSATASSASARVRPESSQYSRIRETRNTS